VKALVFDLSIPKFAALQILRYASRKLIYRGPLSMLRLQDLPEPSLPSPQWVKIRTRLCGFCGSDLNLVMLRESTMASPFTSFPCIIGHELCGDIVEAGREAREFKPGEMVVVSPLLGCAARGFDRPCRACASGRPGNCERFAEGRISPGMFLGICKDVGGGSAEYLVAHRSQVFRVPGGVSPEEAALAEPLSVGLQAVIDNPPQRGEKALIVGGGVIGAMIVKAIRALGTRCEITVVEPSPFHAEYVKASGADQVIGESAVAAAERFAGARSYKPIMGPSILQGGFDRVYDTVGNSKTLQASLIAAASRGTVSLVGISKILRFDPTPLWLKLQTVKGAYGYGYNMIQGKRTHVFETALDLLKRKKLRVADMLTHTFPIEEYRTMIEVNLNKGRHRAMKTAIKFPSS